MSPLFSTNHTLRHQSTMLAGEQQAKEARETNKATTYQQIVSDVQAKLLEAAKGYQKVASKEDILDPIEHEDLTKRVAFVESKSDVVDLVPLYSIFIDEDTADTIFDDAIARGEPVTVLKVLEHDAVTLYQGRIGSDTR